MDEKYVGKPALRGWHDGWRALALGVVVLIGLAAVAAVSAPGASAQTDGIVYRLKWLKNVSAVGGLYALDTGLFQRAHLSVTIKGGGPERDAIRELELGYAQFGVASADQVIRALAKGSPVVVVAQIFQINPLQWIYYDDEPVIDHLAQLKGMTIGVTYGGNDETIMRTLLAEAGLSDRAVHLFSVRYDYTPFFERRVALWPVYINSQAVILADKFKAEGQGIRFLNPGRFGVRFVANSVVTSREMMQAHPDTVKRFLTALLAGWKAALAPENRQRALVSLGRFDRDTPPHILEKQLIVTRSLVQPDRAVPIGTIDAAAWRQTEAILLKQHQIAAPVHVERALRTVQTGS
jgi:NitT/TauT family transport system substrate-binding protein